MQSLLSIEILLCPNCALGTAIVSEHEAPHATSIDDGIAGAKSPLEKERVTWLSSHRHRNLGRSSIKKRFLTCIRCPKMGCAFQDLSIVENNSMDHSLLHSMYFQFAAIHWSNLLKPSRKTATKMSTLISFIISWISERISSAGTNRCPWRWLLRCPNKKQKSQRERSPASAVDVHVVQFARNCYRKILLCLLLYLALHYPHARITSFHFSLHAKQRSRWEYFRYSDLVGDCEHLSFWHAMTSTTWNSWQFHKNVRINFGLWIMYFSRSGISSSSGSQIISWSDLSTSRIMSRQGSTYVICIPIPSLMPDWQQEVAKLDRKFNLTWFAFWVSESLWGTQWRYLISDCEMQRIDKSTIYNL
jgi:hypothetical protein